MLMFIAVGSLTCVLLPASEASKQARLTTTSFCFFCCVNTRLVFASGESCQHADQWQDVRPNLLNAHQQALGWGFGLRLELRACELAQRCHEFAQRRPSVGTPCAIKKQVTKPV